MAHEKIRSFMFGPTDGDVVVIIDHDEVSKLQMPSGTGSFACNTLHGTSIAEETVGIVCEKVKPRLVEDSAGVSLGDGETDGVGETLTQRARGNLHSRSVMVFGMSRSDAIDRLSDRRFDQHRGY